MNMLHILLFLDVKAKCISSGDLLSIDVAYLKNRKI